MPEPVRVHEVAPRDGLQNEGVVLSTRLKLDLVARLVRAGITDIEVGSFVRPSRVPQLADVSELVRLLPPAPGVTWWGLVPNRLGLDRALEAGVPAIATFLSASETHNQKNVNRSVRESLACLREVVASARAEGLRVRSYVSTAFGCPYEGAVDPGRVVRLAGELLGAGAERVALGDTTGVANPAQVARLMERLDAAGIGPDRVALHMHDTRGSALANVLAGLQAGVRVFDASVAGIGGCPFAPGAAGNLATEDLVNMLEGMGFQTGIDLEHTARAGEWIAGALGRTLPGRYHRYHLARRRAAAARTA